MWNITTRWLKWKIIKMRMIDRTQSDATPTDQLLTKTPKCNFSYLQINVTLLVMPEGVRVEKGTVAKGAHQPHPKCTLHMCVQMVAWEIDGPSLQPAIWHLYTLLMPPNWMQRGCILAGISPSKTEGAVEEVDSSACSAGPGTSGSLDSWEGRWEMVADGVWQAFFWGGGAEDMEKCVKVQIGGLLVYVVLC